jgi:hypothetical protein
MNSPHAEDDLRRLYLQQTTKLARVTAALGLAGDEPAEVLEAQARQLRRERDALLAAGATLCAHSERGLDSYTWNIGPGRVEAVQAAVELAQKGRAA